MGGLDPWKLGDEDVPEYPSRFEGGGGTFRPVGEPRMEHPVLRDSGAQGPPGQLGDMYGRNLLENPKKVYDMEALRRLVELLNQNRQAKPYGVPDNANIGF